MSSSNSSSSNPEEDTTTVAEQQPTTTAGAGAVGEGGGRKKRSLSTSAPSSGSGGGGGSGTPGGGERRTSRRERLSGRGFLPSFDEEAIDEEAEAEATADILLDLGRRITWFFGANLAINLPLRLVFLRQAARPLGRPRNGLAGGLKAVLPPLGGGGPGELGTSWKYVLGTSALIGLSEVSAGLFAGLATMYFDSGHIPTVDEWHEHEKPTFLGISRKQMASFAGKLLTGAFFYPFFAVMPTLVASHRWPGFNEFFRSMTSNRNGFWNALLLNMLKYSVIDLAPWLENKLYHYLKLVPEDERNDEDWEHEEEPFFSIKHLEKYGLSLSSTILACLLYVPIDVLITQLILYPSEYNGIVDCAKKIWRVEGWRGLYRGFAANLLSEQELLFI